VGYEGPAGGPCTALPSFHHQLLEEAETRFRDADSNGDGFITGLDVASKRSLEISEGEAVVFLLDMNADGKIEFEEWHSADFVDPTHELWSIITLMYYASINSDESQGMKLSELGDFMTKLYGVHDFVYNAQEAENLIEKMDTRPKDGEVTIHEFKESNKAILGSTPFYSVSLDRTDGFNLNYLYYVKSFKIIDRDDDDIITIQECRDAGVDFITCATLPAAAFVSDPDSGMPAVTSNFTFDMIVKVNQDHPIAEMLTSLAEGCKPCFLSKDSTGPNQPKNCDFLTEDKCLQTGCQWGGWQEGEGCNAKLCTDMPGFLDSQGNGCDIWAENPTWCDGSPEDGIYNPPSEYANAQGIDPSMACCVCKRSDFCEKPPVPVFDVDPCYANFMFGDSSPESCSDPFLGGVVGCCYDVMLGNCSTCYTDGDCAQAPFECAKKFLDECGLEAGNSSVASESFISRATSCSVSPTDPTAAYWNHPGYVLRGNFNTTAGQSARNGISSPSGCAQVCGTMDDCNAFSFIKNQGLCVFFSGSVQDVCLIGSPNCVYNVTDARSGVTTQYSTERPFWVYDVGGIYCAPNSMECGCTREYFQCLLQNDCEGEDDDISSFADMCSARGCSPDQCGLRWSESSSLASLCTNTFFECQASSDGDCGPVGLKWRNLGATKPTSGLLFQNTVLANALATKTEFSKEEWAAFGIPDLNIDNFIKSGLSFFKPAGGCTREFVACMKTTQDAAAVDIKTGLSLIDMCTLEGCSADDCGLEQQFCNASSLTCATDHMACTGGAYEYISWDPTKTGLNGLDSRSEPYRVNKSMVTFEKLSGTLIGGAIAAQGITRGKYYFEAELSGPCAIVGVVTDRAMIKVFPG